MTNKEEALLKIIKDIFWMARRYAHGRHTYAPGMVREAYKYLKRWYPDLEIEHDVTIKPPEEDEIHGMTFRSDYLDDTNICSN